MVEIEWTRRKSVIALIGGIIVVGAIGDETEEDEGEGQATADAEQATEEDNGDETDSSEGMEGREWAATLDNLTQLEIIGYTEQDTGADTQAFMDVATQHSMGQPTSAEVGEIAGGYANYVDSDPNPPKQLFVEVYETTDRSNATATFEIQREWARDYLAGQISESGYANRVLETLSSA